MKQRLRVAERLVAIEVLYGACVEIADRLPRKVEDASPERIAQYNADLDRLLLLHNAARVLEGSPRQTLKALGYEYA